MAKRNVVVPAKVMTVLTATDNVTSKIRCVLLTGGPVELLAAATGATPADRQGAIPLRNMGDGLDGTQTLAELFGADTQVRLFALAETETVLSVAYVE